MSKFRKLAVQPASGLAAGSRLNHLIALLSLIPCALAAGAQPPRLNPPALNQPASFKTFGGPVGNLFEARMEADPHEVRMDASVLLTIRISYRGERGERPQRGPTAPAATELGESFDDSFSVTRTAEEHDGTSWRFTYRLSPRNADSNRVPAVLFTYFSPLGYRTLEMPGIDIKVLPREEISAQDLDQGPASARTATSIDHFVLGPEVLRRDDRWSLPNVLFLTLAFVLPPLLCLGWYCAWRQLYPDEALRLRRRRSRAARLALRGLELAEAARTDLHATMAAAIMTTYLQQRLDLPVREPTPHETAEHLARAGCPQTVVVRASKFFELCDTARFAVDPGQSRDRVLIVAADLIRTMEQERNVR
jgi:hypothetical protein